MLQFLSQIPFPIKHKTFWALILLSIVCTSVNLTKAVHMDDTAHLEIALNILHNPLHPMTGTFNWAAETAFTAMPISHLNQPHLFFYMQALVMLIFGKTELAQHGLMALMSSIVILFFYLIARILVPKIALFLTAVFVLGPVFLPGQNLMVDVPTLAFWLVFFWAILSASKGRSSTYYGIGAIAIAAACLIKYTSLILLPIFLFVMIFRRQWHCLWLIMIPVLALAGWSLFNYFDYGGIHILERNGSTPVPITKRITNPIFAIVKWTVGLGAVASFNVIFLSRTNTTYLKHLKRAARVCLFGGVVIGIVSCVATKSFYIGSWQGFFFANGVFTLCLVYQSLVMGYRLSKEENNNLRRERSLILLIWLAGSFLFIVFFAPFVAIRHILMAVPAILLLLAYNLDHLIEYRWRVGGLILTSVLGLTLAISDYNYAAVYRNYAHKIKMELPSDATIWYGGTWGWQWYASQEGMQHIDLKTTSFRNGDYVIIPAVMEDWVTSPPLASKDQQALRKVKELAVNGNAFTLFRTMFKQPPGGYYFSSLKNSPPWMFSTDALEVFSIYRFESTTRASVE